MNNIQGWMDNLELIQLNNWALNMESVAEIGCWKGRTTKVFLEACKGHVYAIDHWRGNEGLRNSIHKEAPQVFNQFKENVGYYTNLEICKGSSIELATTFSNKSIDMIFIDAGHQYDEVVQDIKAWLPKTKKLICGHDWYAKKVKQAVIELLPLVSDYRNLWYYWL